MGRTTDWRLGSSKYGQKFRYVIATDQPPDQVLAAAEADMKTTRDEMFRIASQLNGDHGNSSDVNATIKRALDAIANRHATPENYFADARRDLEEARQFVREKDLLTLPARDNLQVIETPEFMRGIYPWEDSIPAPALEPQPRRILLDHSDPTVLAEGTSRIKTSRVQLLRPEDPDHSRGDARTLRAVRVCQRRAAPLRRVLRAVFGNGPYVEGWAVYATEFMLETGYLNNSPELRLTFLKHQLRVLANTILDVRLHTMGMTDQQALDLMINDGFQEREEATGKLQRAKLSSAQLPTYYVGWRDWKRLEAVSRPRKAPLIL